MDYDVIKFDFLDFFYWICYYEIWFLYEFLWDQDLLYVVVVCFVLYYLGIFLCDVYVNDC